MITLDEAYDIIDSIKSVTAVMCEINTRVRTCYNPKPEWHICSETDFEHLKKLFKKKETKRYFESINKIMRSFSINGVKVFCITERYI